MAHGEQPELRGFDSYELRLGDVLRGERASLGKSLLEIQRDLRIRADYLDAIENADASAFPYPGFVAGYVRSYARYLDMDPDDVYRRFCEESGFEKPVSDRPVSGGPVKGGASALHAKARRAAPGAGDPASANSGGAEAGAYRQDLDLIIAQSHRMGAHSIDIAGIARGLVSLTVLCALIGGVGYGGWSVLQSVQRVDFAPLPDAPQAALSAPEIASTLFAPDGFDVAAPVPPAPRDNDALAAIYAAQEMAAPVIARRDGPISSIDPDASGIYASRLAPPVIGSGPDAPPSAAVAAAAAARGMVDPGLLRAAELAKSERRIPGEAGSEPLRIEPGVKILARDPAWVQVRAREGVLFSGLLDEGDRYDLPDTAENPRLRVGNAGGVFLVVDGVPYGPLGSNGQVAKNVSLDAAEVREAYPRAADHALLPASAAEDEPVQAAALSSE